MGMPHKHGLLLVDDNPDDVAMIRAALERAFIDNPLYVVGDGEQAIEYLTGAGVYADRNAHPLPHVMLLDLRMPRMDGFAVLRWVRQSPEFAKLCVVVLTQSASTSDVRAAYALGANSFLVKPTDFDDVIRLMRVFAGRWLSPAAPGSTLVDGWDASFEQRESA